MVSGGAGWFLAVLGVVSPPLSSPDVCLGKAAHCHSALTPPRTPHRGGKEGHTACGVPGREGRLSPPAAPSRARAAQRRARSPCPRTRRGGSRSPRGWCLELVGEAQSSGAGKGTGKDSAGSRLPPHLFSAALSHSSLAEDMSASRRWITSSISLSLSFLTSSLSSRSRASSQASWGRRQRRRALL